MVREVYDCVRRPALQHLCAFTELRMLHANHAVHVDALYAMQLAKS
jgi:hypothetical protein